MSASPDIDLTRRVESDHDLLIQLRVGMENMEKTFSRTWDTINDKFAILRSDLDKTITELKKSVEEKADKDDVMDHLSDTKKDLEERIISLEKKQAQDQEHFQKLENWKFWVVGTFTVLGAFLGTVLSAVVVKLVSFL